MQAKRQSPGSMQKFFRPVEIDCSWCGTSVPLPPGDFSGVCIDCGTVMFRPPQKTRAFRTSSADRDVRLSI